MTINNRNNIEKTCGTTLKKKNTTMLKQVQNTKLVETVKSMHKYITAHSPVLVVHVLQSNVVGLN